MLCFIACLAYAASVLCHSVNSASEAGLALNIVALVVLGIDIVRDLANA